MSFVFPTQQGGQVILHHQQNAIQVILTPSFSYMEMKVRQEQLVVVLHLQIQEILVTRFQKMAMQ